ncbi:MAG: LytTR family DNA-binding domain-containing protein [Peptococcaceae bacterium]|nr:LytTR family DNA-binding domain-containing protein [Peptococcaceae bacterium]
MQGAWNLTLFAAICDDEKGISANLENALVKILGKLNIRYEIDIYFTGEELCSKMEDGAHYDLIFLDIEFAKNAINGVEAGRLIREHYQNDMVSIVYISWEMKYSMHLFDIRPLHFLLKPLDYAKVEQVIKTYMKLARLWSGDFTYKAGRDIYKVQIKDIIYLESIKRKVILHLADGRKEEFYGTLKEVWQDQLQRFDFIFIHASYVVNYDYIAAIKYNELVLSHGAAILPISQHKRKDVRESYYAITEKRRV